MTCNFECNCKNRGVTFSGYLVGIALVLSALYFLDAVRQVAVEVGRQAALAGKANVAVTEVAK